MKNDASKKYTNEPKHLLKFRFVENSEDFYILHWWKMRKENYLILSAIAGDLLTYQMSTEAYKSVFNGKDIYGLNKTIDPKSIKFCMLSRNWLIE